LRVNIYFIARLSVTSLSITSLTLMTYALHLFGLHCILSLRCGLSGVSLLISLLPFMAL